MALIQTTAQALTAIATAKTQLTTAANLTAKPTTAQKTALQNAAAALDAVTTRLNVKKSCVSD
jgi:hypothetical protein